MCYRWRSLSERTRVKQAAETVPWILYLQAIENAVESLYALTEDSLWASAAAQFPWSPFKKGAPEKTQRTNNSKNFNCKPELKRKSFEINSKKRFFHRYLNSWDLSRSIRLEKWCRTVMEFLDLLHGASKTAHFRIFPGSLSSAQMKACLVWSTIA